jgi:phage FluMu protein Com
MKEIILTRKDLLVRNFKTEIQHISFNHFAELNRQRFYSADLVIFIDNDHSYKIIKSRYDREGTIVKWVDVLCTKCNKVFNTYDSDMISLHKQFIPCPRCEHVGCLRMRFGNFSWEGRII